jgi:hypothetical protein
MDNKTLDKQVKNKGKPHRWVKGQSGNPDGRPKKTISLTSEMKAQLTELCPYDPTKTWLQYLVTRWLGQAVDNAPYFRELIERLEGKVVQPVQAEVKGNVTFIIGKGYANDKSGIQACK